MKLHYLSSLNGTRPRIILGRIPTHGPDTLQSVHLKRLQMAMEGGVKRSSTGVGDRYNICNTNN